MIHLKMTYIYNILHFMNNCTYLPIIKSLAEIIHNRANKTEMRELT